MEDTLNDMYIRYHELYGQKGTELMTPAVLSIMAARSIEVEEDGTVKE